jgi:hypothetical protein
MLSVDDHGIYIDGKDHPDYARDCWGRNINTEVDPDEIDLYDDQANYLALVASSGGIRSKTRQTLLREKTVRDYNLFMMNHPWQKNVTDNENENKKAYDSAYKKNPQHVADKRNFEEVEARLVNKNSILKAVMTDPGLTLLDYENSEPDGIKLLQNSNQSFVSSRDKFFIKPQLAQQSVSADRLRDAVVDAQGIIQSRQMLEEKEDIGTF